MKHLNKLLLATAFSALLISPATAQNKAASVLDLKYSIQDNNVRFPDSYDTNTQKLLERWYLKNYTTADMEPTSSYDPGATDNEIRERLAALQTQIDLPYNSIVRQYIERYTKNGRQKVVELLGLSSYYMPIFEQALEEAGLPLELKYLPVIESGLNPCATSKHGAAGLWQFIIASAKGYDLEVTSLVDERRDPYLSSTKACQMLKELYETFNDWSLAIAAYNCGPGTVNKALTRAGGETAGLDFWSIYYYLPEETRCYVPMFIAANYVMNYYDKHNIKPVLPTKPLFTDTVHLHDRVHFEQIAAVLDIPIDEIRVLNPQFRADIIPASASRTYDLILPSQQIHSFIVSQNQILAYESEKYARKMDASPGGSPDVTPEELVAEELAYTETRNPADPALIEDAATEIVYEQTHPQQQVTTPTNRRNNNSVKASNSNAANATTEKANTTVTPAKTNTKTATTTTNDTTKKTDNSTTKKDTKKEIKKADNSTTKKDTKKTDSTTKKDTKKADTNTTKKDTKKADSTTKKDTKKDTKSTNSTYTVKSGDSLDRIAKNNGTTVEELRKANPQLKGDMIHPDDKLNLPAKKSTTKETKSTTTNTKKKKK